MEIYRLKCEVEALEKKIDKLGWAVGLSAAGMALTIGYFLIGSPVIFGKKKHSGRYSWGTGEE